MILIQFPSAIPFQPLNPRSAGAPLTRKANQPRINTSTLLIRTPLQKKSAHMLCATMYRKNGNSTKPCAGLSQLTLKLRMPNIVDQGLPRPQGSPLTQQLRYGTLFSGREPRLCRNGAPLVDSGTGARGLITNIVCLSSKYGSQI